MGVTPFIAQDLEQAIAKLKMEKEPGSDHLTIEAVRLIASTILSTMSDIFNNLLKQLKFPKRWKEAAVVLIEKAKNDGYRPIYVLSIFGKLYEQIIKARLQKELEESAPPSDRQFVFVRVLGLKIHCKCDECTATVEKSKARGMLC